MDAALSSKRFQKHRMILYPSTISIPLINIIRERQNLITNARVAGPAARKCVVNKSTVFAAKFHYPSVFR